MNRAVNRDSPPWIEPLHAHNGLDKYFICYDQFTVSTSNLITLRLIGRVTGTIGIHCMMDTAGSQGQLLYECVCVRVYECVCVCVCVCVRMCASR